jgi:precorrin-2 dehydrogenase / sirohydrochlorin ferrochelatase
MSLFPMFVKLEGRRAVVVGAGRIGEPKVKSLLVARADVLVIAPAVSAAVEGWAKAGVIQWEQREFVGADLDDAFLVVAATSSVDVNEQVYRAAQERKILCNAVDDPERCDFYYSSVVRRGQLQVAISTEGQSPALAQRLRRELESSIGPEYAGWLAELGAAREELFGQAMDPEERRLRLHRLASRRVFEARQSAHWETGEVAGSTSADKRRVPHNTSADKRRVPHNKSADKSVRATHEIRHEN